MSEAQNIAVEALEIVNGRRELYGQPEDNFANIAAFWATYLGREITSIDVARMMQLMKIARQMHTHKRDNLVDLIGYALCEERIRNPEAQQA
jgi:hypothetical protein